jgi:hypothetical protein
MMQHRPLDSLHPWLLNGSGPGMPYVLLDTGATPVGGCVQKVVCLLNEFDEVGDFGWVPLDPDTVRSIAASKEHRRLLGIENMEPVCDPTSISGLRRVLTACARRGRCVVNHPEATRALAEDPMGFRAGIGQPVHGIDHFHLILNPNCFRPQCLASLIADSFLEWAATSHAA